MQISPSLKAFNSARRQALLLLVVVAFFSCLINLLMLVGPLYMLQVYDRVLTSGSIPTLIFLTVIAVGLLAISALLQAVRSRLLVRLSGRLDKLVAEHLFDRMFDHTLASGGEGARSLRDWETIRGFLTGSGMFFFFDAPWTPIFLAVIYVFHPLLFLVALGGAVILFITALINEFATAKALRNAAEMNSVANTFADNVLRQSVTVEAMGMMPGLRERWRGRARKALAFQAKASDRSGVFVSFGKFIRPLLQVAILGVGAWLALSHEISAGMMVAASIVMGRALAPVEGAISNWRGFVLSRAAYRRLQTLFETDMRHASTQPLPVPVGNVDVERLVMAPPGGEAPVVKGISFSIQAGDIVGIIGPSASGKSTLARGLVGVWKPSSGAIRLDGMNIGDWNHTELGPHLGYLPQDIELFEGTISENISRFTSCEAEEVIRAAHLANVHDLILRLPQGYDTRVGPHGMVLSGGQRQRIGLARAVFGRPKFIVLDEPNSNLDGEGEDALRQALIDLKAGGATVVVIAHRPSILSVADGLLVLRDGMIESYGPKEDVMSKFARVVK